MIVMRGGDTQAPDVEVNAVQDVIDASWTLYAVSLDSAGEMISRGQTVVRHRHLVEANVHGLLDVLGYKPDAQAALRVRITYSPARKGSVKHMGET